MSLSLSADTYSSTDLDHKAKKRVATDSALTKRPPTQEERFLIHDLYLEYSKYDDPHLKVKKPDDVEWMEETKQSSITIMQPQDRNIHDKVRLSFFPVTKCCFCPSCLLANRSKFFNCLTFRFLEAI